MDDRSDSAVYSGTISQINAAKPAFLIDLGDDFMIDKLPQKSDESIRARFELMKSFYDQLSPTIPFYLVMGNHDGETGWDSLNTHAVRAQYFPEQTYELNYYSFEQADSLFIALDPYSYTPRKPDADGWGWTLGKEQYDWLTQKLETSTAQHKFVFIHQLVGGNNQGRGGSEWSSYFEWGGKNLDGSDGFATNRPGWEMPLADLFTKFGVDIVFKGHDHFYAHQESNDVTLQTLPQPSHPGDRLNADPVNFGYMAGTILGGSGYLLVTTHADETEVTFVGADGTTRDRYTVPIRKG